MELPVSTTYSNSNGTIKVMVPYGESAPPEITDLMVGLDFKSTTFLKSETDTVDWGEKGYAIMMLVRTYNSKILGPVQIEYQPDHNSFSKLPNGTMEKLGSLTLIGKKTDSLPIIDEEIIREILGNGFRVVPPQQPNSRK